VANCSKDYHFDRWNKLIKKYGVKKLAHMLYHSPPPPVSTFGKHDYREERSYFHDDGILYDLNILFNCNFIPKNILIQDILLPENRVCPERLRTANPNIPVLVYFGSRYQKYIIIDGEHRVRKSLLDGRKIMKAKIIKEEELSQAEVSKIIPTEEATHFTERTDM